MYPTPVIVILLYTQIYDCEVNNTACSHGCVPLIYLTLKLLTTTIVAPPSNASKWQAGFNSAFKGLNIYNMTVEAGTSGDTDLYSGGRQVSQTTTALRESRGIALLGTRRGWGVTVTPRPHLTPGKEPVPIIQEPGWASGPVWTGAENLAPTGIRSPDRPARRQSLNRLRYPAAVFRRYLLKMWVGTGTWSTSQGRGSCSTVVMNGTYFSFHSNIRVLYVTV